MIPTLLVTELIVRLRSARKSRRWITAGLSRGCAARAENQMAKCYNRCWWFRRRRQQWV